MTKRSVKNRILADLRFYSIFYCGEEKMTYCRYCGVEISYKRSKNEKWIPCDSITGEPHFCREDKNKKPSGIVPCPVCGKPTFIQKQWKKKVPIDYSTLAIHQCKKADVTRYAKYQQMQLKADMARSATSRSKKNSGRRTYDKKFQKERQELD